MLYGCGKFTGFRRQHSTDTKDVTEKSLAFINNGRKERSVGTFYGMYNRLHVNVHIEFEPKIYGTGKRIGISFSLRTGGWDEILTWATLAAISVHLTQNSVGLLLKS